MSENYKQTTISGEAWVRTKRIVIENEFGTYPKVKFVEEKRVNLQDGSVMNQDNGSIEVESSPETMDLTIRIVDPATGKYIGKDMTYAEIYAAVHSAYLFFAKRRDNPPQPDYDPTVGGTDEIDYLAEEQYIIEESSTS